MEGERVNHTIPTNSIQEKERERERETSSNNESQRVGQLLSFILCGEGGGGEGGRKGGRADFGSKDRISQPHIHPEGREGGREVR